MPNRAIGSRFFPILLAVAAVTAPLPALGQADFGTGNVSIPLDAGLNLISIPVEPADPSADTILGSLGSLVGAAAFDASTDTWTHYDPLAPAFVNDLTTIEPGMALVVLMSAAETLVVDGEPVNSLEITVEPGWNLIGDIGGTPRTPESTFAEVDANVSTVITLVDGVWQTFDPLNPTAPFMVEPGMAFWIYDTVAETWFLSEGVHQLASLRADLFIDRFVVTADTSAPDPPLEGEGFQLCAYVGNKGYQSAVGVETRFYSKAPSDTDYSLLGTVTQPMTESVDRGDDDAFCLPVASPAFVYQTKVKAIVNEGSPPAIPELDEKNNRYIEMIYLRMPNPSIPQVATISPVHPFTDSVVQITTNVENLGDADADDFTLRISLKDENDVELWFSDTTFGSGGESALAPGETRPYNGTVDIAAELGGPVAEGWYQFSAALVLGSGGSDSDTSNNDEDLWRELRDAPLLTLEDPVYCCWRSPLGPKVGDDVTVSLTVANEGGSAATNVEATYDDTSVTGETWTQGTKTTIPNIADGDVEYTFNVLESVAVGAHDLAVAVEYTDEQPPRTVDLALTPTLQVRDLLPDLVARYVDSDQDHPTTASAPTFTIGVANSDDETGSGGPFKVGLYWTQVVDWQPVDLHFIADSTVSGLAQGGRTTVNIAWSSPPASGLYTMVGWVDWDDALAEIGEGNNLVEQRDVFIRDTGPDFWAESTWTVPDNPMQDRDADLNCYVSNAGDANGTFDATFQDRDDATPTTLGTVTGVSLAAGDDTVVTITADWDEDGTHEVACVVSGANDSYMGNDEDTSTIWVRAQNYSVVQQPMNVYVDKTQAVFDWGNDGIRGKGWAYSDSVEGCFWDTWFGIPYYNCDFQDTSRVRVTAYRTFEVRGPANGSTYADIDLDVQLLGIIDTLNFDLTGATDWGVLAKAGVFEGEVDGLASYNLNYPAASQVLLDTTVASTILDIVEGAISVVGELCQSTGCEAVFGPILALFDGLTADVVVLEKGVATFEDVHLRSGQKYTAFVYVDLYNAAVGVTSVSYSDFYYHQPHNDLLAKQFLTERGVWLNGVQVHFK